MDSWVILDFKTIINNAVPNALELRTSVRQMVRCRNVESKAMNVKNVNEMAALPYKRLVLMNSSNKSMSPFMFSYALANTEYRQCLHLCQSHRYRE